MGKLSLQSLHEFQLLECKHKTARWTGAREFCFSSDQVQLLWCVFVQIKLLSRGTESGNANSPGRLPLAHRSAHSTCWKGNSPERLSSVSSSNKKKKMHLYGSFYALYPGRCQLEKATERMLTP